MSDGQQQHRREGQHHRGCRNMHARVARQRQVEAKGNSGSEAIRPRSGATTAPSASSASTSSAARDPQLNFLSREFDALKALRTPGLMPPIKIKPLDYLARARVLLPPDHPDHIPPASLKRKDRSAESIAAQARAKSRTVVKEQQQHVLKAAGDHNPLKDIMDTVNPKAPVAMLRKVVEVGGRVRVVTRHAGGVRGVAIGFLVAFDKYMNLLLRDVDEDYKVRVQVSRTKVQTVSRASAGTASSSGGATATGVEADVDALTETFERSRIRWRPKLEARKRHLKQVLIRGDSVVLVNRISGGGQLKFY